jgi:hypothetical protein
MEKPEDLFEDCEEAALWLEEANYVVNDGKIHNPRRLIASNFELAVITWLVNNFGYEVIGGLDSLKYIKRENQWATSNAAKSSNKAMGYERDIIRVFADLNKKINWDEPY